jgi:hypothetical protein
MMADTGSLTRWAVRVPEIDGLMVDNFGFLTLHDRREYNRPGPDWTGEPAGADEPPRVSFVPDHWYGVSYLPVRMLPVSIERGWDLPSSRYVRLHVYRFGYRTIRAAFAPEINTWWIVRPRCDSAEEDA